MLRRFFQDYKQLEGKSVEVDEIQPSEVALPVIEDVAPAIQRAPPQGVPLSRCVRSSSAARGRSAAGSCACLAERGHEAVGHLRHGRRSPAWSPRRRRPGRRGRPGSASQRPDVVFYPAGFTWVDGCERDPGRARVGQPGTAPEPGPRRRPSRGPGSSTSPPTTSSTAGTARTPRTTRPTRSRSTAGPSSRPSVPWPRRWASRSLTRADVLGLRARAAGQELRLSTRPKTLREGEPLVCPSDQVSNPSYGPDVARAVVALAEAGRRASSMWPAPR